MVSLLSGSLSGWDPSAVRVGFNSSEPAPGTVAFLPSQYSNASPNLVTLIPDESATEKKIIRQDVKANRN